MFLNFSYNHIELFYNILIYIIYLIISIINVYLLKHWLKNDQNHMWHVYFYSFINILR